MASFRALFILAFLAVALFLRPAGVLAQPPVDPAQAPVAPKKQCPVDDKTCRPGDPQASENQEEEAPGMNVQPGSTPGVPTPGREAEMKEDLPDFNKELTVLGH
jgi:hypothetical protein